MKKSIKISIFICLLFVSVGYAAISTSLDLRGLVSFGANVEDFKVYISRVTLNDENISDVISEDGNSFKFTAYPNSGTLTYRVMNMSTQYDAYVTLSCSNTADVTLNIEQVELIEAQTIESRNIEITIGEDHIEEITCTLNLEQIERTVNAADGCCNNANGITFEPSDSSWKVTTVEEALNYLRSRSN